MLPQVQDTIVALSSAPGPGARAIVRLSGVRAFDVLTRIVDQIICRDRRCVVDANVRLPGVASSLPTQSLPTPA